MIEQRLTSFENLPTDLRQPAYTPSDHAAGIVHIGLGAFHKAHQAVYTDDALARAGGDWRIIGVSLRSPKAAEELNPQNGLYTVIERGAEHTTSRVIGSIADVIAGQGNTPRILETLSNPAIRIVSITVTEKAYGIDRSTGGVDKGHPAVAVDLTNPENPIGVLGILVAALAQRQKSGIDPFTILCCDNLPENGDFLRAGVIDFAHHIDMDLANWIRANVSFPSTMVDRITPATTEDTLASAKKALGRTDLAAIETEPFSQWVIEDNFPGGRPAWDAGGALFVKDVLPYENMKLRMLNGAHSMLAYTGFMSGQKYVSDAMQHPDLSVLVKRHIMAAADTLDPMSGMDLGAYADSLMDRFSNPNIRHETYQIAMDGTEKLPQRIFQPAIIALRNGQTASAFAFATAAWMRYCIGRTDENVEYDLRDPRQDQISNSLSGLKSPHEISKCLFGLTGLFPDELFRNKHWMAAVISKLSTMLDDGMSIAVRNETQ